MYIIANLAENHIKDLSDKFPYLEGVHPSLNSLLTSIKDNTPDYKTGVLLPLLGTTQKLENFFNNIRVVFSMIPESKVVVILDSEQYSKITPELVKGIESRIGYHIATGNLTLNVIYSGFQKMAQFCSKEKSTNIPVENKPESKTELNKKLIIVMSMSTGTMDTHAILSSVVSEVSINLGTSVLLDSTGSTEMIMGRLSTNVKADSESILGPETLLYNKGYAIGLSHGSMESYIKLVNSLDTNGVVILSVLYSKELYDSIPETDYVVDTWLMVNPFDEIPEEIGDKVKLVYYDMDSYTKFAEGRKLQDALAILDCVPMSWFRKCLHQKKSPVSYIDMKGTLVKRTLPLKERVKSLCQSV